MRLFSMKKDVCKRQQESYFDEKAKMHKKRVDKIVEERKKRCAEDPDYHEHIKKIERECYHRRMQDPVIRAKEQERWKKRREAKDGI